MPESKIDWAKPIPVDDVTLAFPAHVVGILMPEYLECQEGLERLDPKEMSKWLDFQRSWFMRGLPAEVEFYCKEGVDGETAFRQLQAIQGSFQPKHQHKEAAVAYLCSLWFDDIKNYQ